MRREILRLRRRQPRRVNVLWLPVAVVAGAIAAVLAEVLAEWIW